MKYKQINHTFKSEYNSFNAMKQRCYYKANSRYSRYGGRGIAVCADWLDSFETFIHDMGAKPTESHTLERLDSDKDYTPSNCKWATRLEQQRNKSNMIYVTFKGETKLLIDWARELGIPKGTLYSRYYAGRRVL